MNVPRRETRFATPSSLGVVSDVPLEIFCRRRTRFDAVDPGAVRVVSSFLLIAIPVVVAFGVVLAGILLTLVGLVSGELSKVELRMSFVGAIPDPLGGFPVAGFDSSGLFLVSSVFFQIPAILLVTGRAVVKLELLLEGGFVPAVLTVVVDERIEALLLERCGTVGTLGDFLTPINDNFRLFKSVALLVKFLGFGVNEDKPFGVNFPGISELALFWTGVRYLEALVAVFAGDLGVVNWLTRLGLAVFVGSLEDLLGDGGKEVTTGSSGVEGSSLTNVPWRSNTAVASCLGVSTAPLFWVFKSVVIRLLSKFF